jgi:hypothetical protein
LWDAKDLYSPRWQGQHWADDLRNQTGLGIRPIPDIFAFVESLGIVYLRYPAGNAKERFGHASVKALNETCGFSSGLVCADQGVHASESTIDKMARLYKEGVIPFGSFKQSLGMLQLTPEQFGFSPPIDDNPLIEEPDVTWDDILERLGKGEVSD